MDDSRWSMVKYDFRTTSMVYGLLTID